jgi:RNA polymerase-binding transcription factor DksA
MKHNTLSARDLREVRAELEREHRRFAEHDGRRDSYARALARLAEDRYGICESCGDSISVDRLRAIPETAYCITCGSRSTPAARFHQLTAAFGD